MAQFEKSALALPGAVLLTPVTRSDARGCFVKTFHLPDWAALGIEFTMREEFYSVSARGVLRGMHFQAPPAAHAKVVTCLRGRVLDVILDLRADSPAYGRHLALELDDRRRQLLYLPTGIAHGFLALEDDTLVLYKTDHEYAPEYDTGVRFDSFGYDWPVEDPVMSPRDRELPAFGEEGYQTPFP